MTERSALAAGLSVRVPRGTDAPAFARHVVPDMVVIVSELTTNATLRGLGEIRSGGGL